MDGGGDPAKSLRVLRDTAWRDREDPLGFAPSAATIAKLARSTEPPLTMGLYGDWGSGKTSLLGLV